MKDTSLVRVDMKTCSPETLRSWADCYCQIWKEQPWNEDFWQPENVVEDFRRLMLKPEAKAFLAVHGDQIAGFTLGYSVDLEGLRAIAGNSMMDPLFEKHNRIFYIGELGVAANYRGQRISFDLTTALIHVAQASGLKGIVLRTHIQAHIARHVYEKLAFIELNIHDAKYSERTYWLLEVDHE